MMIQSLHNQIFNLHRGFCLLGGKKKKDYLPGTQKGYKDPNTAYRMALTSIGKGHWKKILLDF